MNPASELGVNADATPWLISAPRGWKVQRIKDSVAASKNGVWGNDPVDDAYDLWCVRVADFDRTRLSVSTAKKTIRNVPDSDRRDRMIQRGDLLLEKSGGGETSPVGFVVQFLNDEPAVCSNFVAVVKIKSTHDPRFWLYFHSYAYSFRLNQRSIKQTSGIQNLDQQSYFNEPVAVPPLDEQRQIAEYLDRETGKIDELIGKQQQMIATLDERRVTRTDQRLFGLHGGESARRHFLGAHLAIEPWLAGAPSEWQIVRFRALFCRVEERNESSNETMLSLRITGELVDRAEMKVQQEPSVGSISRYLVAHRGDLVVNPMWLTGGSIGVSERSGAVSPDYRVFRSTGSLLPRYGHHLLRSSPYRAQYVLYTRANTTFDRRIQQRDLNDMPILVPPLSEQQRIVEELDAADAQLAPLVSRAKRLIETLRERRAALISAAVTGKIDVRGL